MAGLLKAEIRQLKFDIKQKKIAYTGIKEEYTEKKCNYVREKELFKEDKQELLALQQENARKNKQIEEYLDQLDEDTIRQAALMENKVKMEEANGIISIASQQPTQFIDLFIKEIKEMQGNITFEEEELRKVIQQEQIKYVSVVYRQQPIIFRTTDDNMTFEDLLTDACNYFHLDPAHYILKDVQGKIWSNYLMIREELMMEANSKFFLEYRSVDRAQQEHKQDVRDLVEKKPDDLKQFAAGLVKNHRKKQTEQFCHQNKLRYQSRMSYAVLKELELEDMRTQGKARQLGCRYVCQTIMFGLFCAVMIYYLNYTQYQESSYSINKQFNDFFEATPFHADFENSNSFEILVKDVRSLDQVYNYITDVGKRLLNQRISWNKDYDKLYNEVGFKAKIQSQIPGIQEWPTNNVYLNSNTRLLGSFRLLHFKVKPDMCQLINFSSTIKSIQAPSDNGHMECLAQYSVDNREDRDDPKFKQGLQMCTYNDDEVGTDSSLFKSGSHSVDGIAYTEAQALDYCKLNRIFRYDGQIYNFYNIDGMLAQYTAQGFFEDFGFNRQDFIDKLKHFKKNNMLNQYTRGVFLVFHFYNPNLKILSYARVGFEVSEQGLFVPANQYFSLKVFRRLTRVTNIFDSYYDFYTNFVWLLCFTYWSVQTVYKVRSLIKRPAEVLSLDAIIFFGFSGFSLALTIWDFLQVLENQYLEGEMAKGETDQFFINFEWSVYHQKTWQLLAFFQKLFFTLLLVQKVNFLQLHSLVLVFKTAYQTILGFVIALSVVISSYAIFGYRMYGNYLYQFSTIINTIYGLFQVLMGNQQLYVEIVNISQFTIYIYLIAFMLFFNFGMMFVFMGLIGNSYRRQQKVIPMQMELDRKALRLVWAKFQQESSSVFNFLKGKAKRVRSQYRRVQIQKAHAKKLRDLAKKMEQEQLKEE